MGFLGHWLSSFSTVTAALVGVAMATLGWLYTCRRNLRLSRKQHTFTALLNTSFAPMYHENMDKIRVPINTRTMPDLDASENAQQRRALQFILNYYEFIAAGVRNGDISERLLRDSERGTIVKLFEVSQGYIGSIKTARDRQAVYEHIEWLYKRWHESPPGWWQRVVEWAIQRPLYHDRHRWAVLVIVVLAVLALVVLYLHLPGEAFNPSPLSPVHH
jgi:Domain of unknown function (DUF4760)